MSPIKPKWQMSEEDIKLHYITPAITAKWGLDRITMETKITDGRINLRGNLLAREKPKRADYIPYINANKDMLDEKERILHTKGKNPPFGGLGWAYTPS